MNPFLMKGRCTPENLCLVMEDATTVLTLQKEQPILPINQALADSIKKRVSRIKETGLVSRSDLVLLDSHFPAALKDLPLTVWTVIPSTTGMNLALEAFESALSEIDNTNVLSLLTQLHTAITNEADGFADILDVYDDAIDEGVTNISKVMADIANGKEHAAQINVEYARCVAEEEKCEQLLALKEARKRLGDTPEFKPGQLTSIVTRSRGLLLEMMKPFTEKTLCSEMKTLEGYIPGETISLEGDFVNNVEEFQGTMLSECYVEMRAVSPLLKDTLADLAKLRDLVADTIGKLPTMSASELEMFAAMCPRLLIMGKHRANILVGFLEYFSRFVGYGSAQLKMYQLCHDRAKESDADGFWPKLEAEVLAHDGYTVEGAGEALKRAIGYLINFLEKIGRWMVSRFDASRAKTRVKQAADLGPVLSKADGSVFDGGKQKRLDKAYTTGIKQVKTYLDLGTIWSDAFRKVNSGLANPVSLLMNAFAVANRGDEVSPDKLNEIRKSLVGVLESAPFDKLPGISSELSLENVSGQVAEVRARVNNAFGQSTGQSPDIATLKTTVTEIKSYLEGPALTLYNTVNGAEFKNLATKLNSMERQITGSAHNKQLSPLVDFINGIRNLIQAATTMLGICTGIADKCGSFIALLSEIVSKEASRKDNEVIGQQYKAESFDITFTNDCDTKLLQPIPLMYPEVVDLLAYSGFTASRESRFNAYADAIVRTLRSLYHAQRRREMIQTHLQGVFLNSVPDVDVWTLGLDYAPNMPAMYAGIMKSFETFMEGMKTSQMPEDSNGLAPGMLGWDVVPGFDSAGNWVSYYRELAQAATTASQGILSPSERVELTKSFLYHDKPFDCDKETIPVVDDLNSLELDALSTDRLQQYAILLTVVMDAYIQLCYGSDHLLFKFIIDNKQ